jgi:hypothetical protein
MAIDLNKNNVYVIDVNDIANNFILISLWRYYIESCNRNTVDSPRGAHPPLL